jgi:hypothetical protein
MECHTYAQQSAPAQEMPAGTTPNLATAQQDSMSYGILLPTQRINGVCMLQQQATSRALVQRRPANAGCAQPHSQPTHRARNTHNRASHLLAASTQKSRGAHASGAPCKLRSIQWCSTTGTAWLRARTDSPAVMRHASCYGTHTGMVQACHGGGQRGRSCGSPCTTTARHAPRFLRCHHQFFHPVLHCTCLASQEPRRCANPTHRCPLSWLLPDP